MTTQKIIDIADRAKLECLKENTIYEAKDVEYSFAQRVIELTLAEVVDAVDTTSLKERTYTTHDKATMDFCRDKFRQEIENRFK